MVYEIPASKASIKQNLFEFKVPGEKKLRSMPKQQFINGDLRARLAKVVVGIRRHQADGTDPGEESLLAIQELQREVLEHYNPDLYKLLDSDQITALLKQWGEESNIELGESSASAAS